jgi:FkbM family methyltransferase
MTRALVAFPVGLRALAAVPWPIKRALALSPRGWRVYAGLARRAGWRDGAFGWVAAANGPYAGIRLRAWHPNLWWIVAGTYEPIVTDWIERAIAAVVRRGQKPVVWDVGANVGVTALLAAKCGAEVVAFEPAPETLAELRGHCEANPSLASRITVRPAAVAEREGTLVLRASIVGAVAQLEHPGVSAYGSGVAVDDADSRVEVPTLTLDTCLEASPAPTIVKVDVEGAEALVLEGAAALLARRDAIWIIELHHAPVTQVVLSSLAAADYEVRRIDPASLGVLHAVDPSVPLGTGHLIAVPPGMDWP